MQTIPLTMIAAASSTLAIVAIIVLLARPKRRPLSRPWLATAIIASAIALVITAYAILT